jgi:hypothetical protein
VRLSLTIPDERLEEGVRRMKALAGGWRNIALRPGPPPSLRVA